MYLTDFNQSTGLTIEKVEEIKTNWDHTIIITFTNQDVLEFKSECGDYNNSWIEL